MTTVSEPEPEEARDGQGYTQQRYINELMELLVTHHGGELSEQALDEGINELHRAVDLACASHAGQHRKSGELYIFHPLRVAHLAARHWMGFPSIIAALLHDVVEDTPVGIEQVRQEYGDEVALLVNGLTKYDEAKLSREVLKEKTYRKQLLAALEDIRVLCLKFWDRMDNLETIGALPANKQSLIAEETRNIYVPLARHLGMGQVADKLEALSLQVLYPRRAERYHKTLSGLAQRYSSDLKRIRSEIAGALKKQKIPHVFRDLWRPFSLKSTQNIKRGISSIYSLEIQVDRTMDAYVVLGLLHGLYPPITGKLRDHLNAPSPFGYQALKTTVQAGQHRLRVMVTTRKLARFNESGVLAPGFEFRQENFQDLLGSLLDGEFAFDKERLRLASASIQVYTPTGESRILPEGSSALDFAFDIHEELGLYAFRARINGQTRLLRSHLLDGDQVRIETANNPRVLPKWLDWAVTPKARNAIRRYLRHHVKNDQGYTSSNNQRGAAKGAAPTKD